MEAQAEKKPTPCTRLTRPVVGCDALLRRTQALMTTMIIMTTGSADAYRAQLLVNPAFAHTWHWFLIVVLWVVCLNMVLCILVDAYSDAQTRVQEYMQDLGECADGCGVASCGWYDGRTKHRGFIRSSSSCSSTSSCCGSMLMAWLKAS